MTSRDFCFWFQGFIEINDAANDRPFAPDEQEPAALTLTAGQVRTIKRHLNMVFKHEIDPSFGVNQKVLNEIHGTQQGKQLEVQRPPSGGTTLGPSGCWHDKPLMC